MNKPTGKKCSTPGCNHDALGGKRGKCATCYQVLRRLVASGKTTWDDLVAAGECSSTETRVQTAYGQRVMERLAKLKKRKRPGIRPLSEKCFGV